MLRVLKLDKEYNDWCAIDPRYADLFFAERKHEEQLKLGTMMNQFKEVTWPRYVSFCTLNLSQAITCEMKHEDIVVKVEPLPATSELLEFEVESTIKLSSVPGVDLDAHA